MDPSITPPSAIIEPGHAAMRRTPALRSPALVGTTSVIVELDLPSPMARVRRVDPTHMRPSARAYRTEIEPADELARRAALEEARLNVRAITGREPVVLDAGDSLVVDATTEEIARIRALARVRDVVPNQALVGTR